MVNLLCGGMHVQCTISMCKIKVRKIIMNETKYIMCPLLHENLATLKFNSDFENSFFSRTLI